MGNLRSIPSVVKNMVVVNDILGTFTLFGYQIFTSSNVQSFSPRFGIKSGKFKWGAYIPFEKRSSRGYLMHAYQVDCTVLSPICDFFRRKRHETLRWCFSRYVDIRSWKRLRIFYVIVLLCLGGEILWEFCLEMGDH